MSSDEITDTAEPTSSNRVFVLPIEKLVLFTNLLSVTLAPSLIVEGRVITESDNLSAKTKEDRLNTNIPRQEFNNFFPGMLPDFIENFRHSDKSE